jgi:hypothetical protein
MEKRKSFNFEGINVDFPAYMNNLKLAGILMDLSEKVRSAPPESINSDTEPSDTEPSDTKPNEQVSLSDEQTPNEHTDLSA